MESNEKIPLTPAEEDLKEVLLNKVQFNQQPYNDSIFETDLVIKVQYPQSRYVPKKNQVSLGSFVKIPPIQLVHAYNAAFDALLLDMEKKNDYGDQGKNSSDVLQIRNATSFEDINVEKQEQQPCAYKKLNLPDIDKNKHLALNCRQKYTGIIDAFIIQLNTLIYVLQKFCGFSIRSFLVSEQDLQKPRKKKKKQKKPTKNKAKSIYILLSQKKTNLLKAANRYKIKKQIDYAQFDLYINDPADKKGRPIKLNSAFKKIQEENPDEVLNEKYINRRLGAKSQNVNLDVNIEDEDELEDLEIKNYQNYMGDLANQAEKLLGKKNSTLYHEYQKDEYSLTEQQKDYLGEFCVAKKNNLGVQKLYLQIKKKRKYQQILKDLCERYGYNVYKPPKTFVDFTLANKKKKFFERWKYFLFYKESVVNPYGDLSLFNKMERIKLSYLILREFIRVQNLHMINCSLFALNDNFDKYGELKSQIDPRQPKENIEGGIDGKNLANSWPKWIWPIDYKTCRNYLGEAVTYQILVKSNLLNLFLVLIPVGIPGEIIKNTVVIPAYETGNFAAEAVFNILFFLIIVVVINVFIAKMQEKEQKFRNNYMQTQRIVTFRYQFKGPYSRNFVTDSVNQYVPKKSLKSALARAFFILLVFCILGVEIAFYVGCRGMTVAIAQIFPEFDTSYFYLLFPTRLFGYILFFVTNVLLYPFIIVPFTRFLTELENVPTEEDFKESHESKLYIFLIGIQMIGPIDNIFIQPLLKTSCLTNWCYTQFLAYVYCRYFIILGLLIFRIIYNFCRNVQNIQIFTSNKKITFEEKLADYLTFVEKESSKKEPDFKLIDETISLLIYCLFGLAFPLAAVFSFLLMYLDYFFQRREILTNSKRPISKSQNLESYTPKAYTILHWMIFSNLAVMFITLEWIEFIFQDLVLAISPVPTITIIFVIKIFAIFIFMIIYQIIGFIVRKIVRSFVDVRTLRKTNKYARLLQTGNRTAVRLAGSLKKPSPLKSIARIFNVFSKNNESEEDNEDESASISSKSKHQ